MNLSVMYADGEDEGLTTYPKAPVTYALSPLLLRSKRTVNALVSVNVLLRVYLTH